MTNNREVTTVSVHVEEQPAPNRRVTELAAVIESQPAPWRRTTELGLMVEYKHLIDNWGNTGGAFCPICWLGALISSLPVNIQYGEKMEQITDLSLTIPTGLLAFTRIYRQSKLSAFQQPLGLGWTHNHVSSLTQNNAVLTVQLPNAGEFSFYLSGSSTHYIAGPGSTSYVDYSSANDQFTLTAMDKTQYVFENNGGINYRLKKIGWANMPNQVWNYLYDTPAGSPGKLTEVNDGYVDSNNHTVHKLVFNYATVNGQPMLQYVGDQTFKSSNLTGRYVAYGYSPNKVFSGGIINGSQNVLSSVRDIRGNTWTYSYYGQQSAETDPNQLNFLTHELSPTVDSTGSGSSGKPLRTYAVGKTD